MDQPGMVTNLARGQLKRENESPCMFECMVNKYSRLGINRHGYQSCSWSAEQGKMSFSLSSFAPENLVLRDSFGRPVTRPTSAHSFSHSG